MRPPRRLLAVAAVLVAGTLGGSALGGCAVARNELGTHTSLCFRVLPEAKAAVGKRAIFAGVVSTSGDTVVRAVERMRNHRPLPLSLRDVKHDATCLVAYRGEFTVARVERGWAPVPGPYRAAIVVVRPAKERVVMTVLFRKLPRSINFHHGLT
ncbi:MAG TPA: hypothetical protein VEH29_03695 [Acidimicrobiales bacterium]|nr:hypothetical protein [Acidimicrobiales bacterium]